MTEIVSFDPINLRIVEIDVGGDNELDVVEIYSEWKLWVKQGTNSKHPQAFRFEGGSQISPQRTLGITYFIMNGWKIRPAERNHKLSLIGNLYSDGGTAPVFVPTLGNYTVNIETQVSSIIDVPSTVLSNSDLSNIKNSVWNKENILHNSGSMGEAIQNMFDTSLGSWSIENSQMIMYKSGSQTPLVIFDLKDKYGNEITDYKTQAPFKRIRVS